MLTSAFYVTLASALIANSRQQMYLAVGVGESSWDGAPPNYQRDMSQLVNELDRKAVQAADFCFIDDAGEETQTPTPRMKVRVRFLDSEAVGTLRECGLFAGNASPEPGSGTLLSYIVHDRIEKSAEMELTRALTIDLTPGATNVGQVATRYLGNSNSRELHDLENSQVGCRIDAIRFDRRIYFANQQQASSLGYDFCAYCFGRELSRR